MGKSGFRRPRFPFLLLVTSFRRLPLYKKSWLLASACLAYLLVALIGHTRQQQQNSILTEHYRRGSGLYDSDPDQSRAPPRTADSQLGALSPAQSHSNVVYITLRSKLLKPANIRGTVRPKLRRKSRRIHSTKSAFTQSKFGTLASDAGQRSVREGRGEDAADYRLLKIIPGHHADRRDGSQINSIRIYSQRAPPWLSAHDMEALRFLAGAKVWRVKEVSRGDSASLLVFEGETAADRKSRKPARVCAETCGVIGSPVENTEVFAFHLDRVLGLNRTPPAVSRKFRFLHGTSADGREFSRVWVETLNRFNALSQRILDIWFSLFIFNILITALLFSSLTLNSKCLCFCVAVSLCGPETIWPPVQGCSLANSWDRLQHFVGHDISRTTKVVV